MFFLPSKGVQVNSSRVKMKRRRLMTIQPKFDADNFAERVHLNQQKLAVELKSHYDFIICGAGTSGSVVAARLAAESEDTSAAAGSWWH